MPRRRVTHAACASPLVLPPRHSRAMLLAALRRHHASIGATRIRGNICDTAGAPPIWASFATTQQIRVLGQTAGCVPPTRCVCRRAPHHLSTCSYSPSVLPPMHVRSSSSAAHMRAARPPTPRLPASPSSVRTHPVVFAHAEPCSSMALRCRAQPMPRRRVTHAACASPLVPPPRHSRAMLLAATRGCGPVHHTATIQPPE